jgi:enoyl-CoA hydratase/carnithine racemase
VHLGVVDQERWETRAVELQQTVFASEDAKEGATAFIERRPPAWRGR